MPSPDPLTDALVSAVASGVFPGAAMAVRVQGRVTYQRAVGNATLLPAPHPASLDTVYDLASLTKPLATTSAVLMLVQTGRLDLDLPLQQAIKELKDRPIGTATARDLLSHSSGLPAWRPYYERVAEQDRTQPGFLGSEAAKDLVLRCLWDEPFHYPPRTKNLYSDLGFILLGILVERVTGVSLDRWCRDQLFDPLRADPLLFLGSAQEREGRPVGVDRIAATEEDPWRGRVLRGEVHDENAYALGGVAGHAGLFGTVSAVLAVSGAWLNGWLGRGALFSQEVVRRFVTKREGIPGGSWGLGWDSPSAPSSSGAYFSPQSFGHLGFTGTSLWIDPVCELEVVLLSNRVHPTRRSNGIQKFRPLIHDLAYKEFIH